MVLNTIGKAVLFSASIAFLSFGTTSASAQEIINPQDIIGPSPILGDTIIELMADHQMGEDTLFNYPEELIADQLACLQNEVPLRYNKTVKAFINYLTVRRRSYTRTMLERKHIYFPIFEEELKKQGLPDELKYLPVVESGLNPRAVSVARAVGLWQFISSAGREYGLYQDALVDERMDPYEATKAGVRYLKVLHDMFGDWELAMAAYNCGPGNVRRAIRRSGNKTGFWQIYNYLPRETRSYVPMFVATTYVMNHHKTYNIRPDSLARYIPHDTILVNQYVDLALLAKQLTIPVEDLQWLNPHLKRSVVPAHMKDFVLRVPKETMSVLTLNRQSVLDSASRQPSPAEAAILLAAVKTEPAVVKSSSGGSSTSGKKRIAHTVRRGDVLGEIADKYHVTLTDLRKWNNIRGNKIRVGQKLYVWIYRPVKQAPDSEPKVNAVASVDKEPSASAKVYMVQPGDTLWSISRVHGNIPVEKIKKLNKLKTNELKPGQKLIIG